MERRFQFGSIALLWAALGVALACMAWRSLAELSWLGGFGFVFWLVMIIGPFVAVGVRVDRSGVGVLCGLLAFFLVLLVLVSTPFGW
jgi:hypothetical protein